LLFAGGHLPLASPGSDARQNLVDALTCALSNFLRR
jgi:L-asparaginase/Glu-tRNA(Gln) amidotransferase subunit D